MINSFLKSRVKSFLHAFAGLKYILYTQKNSWIHLLATILVIIMAFWLKLNFVESAVLVLVIGLVWSAEAFNTCIETLINLITPDFHPLAKISKDVGASAVLFSTFTAIIIGLLIMGPHLLQKLK